VAERYAFTILKGLSVTALALAVVGLFSVIAYTVDSRMNEFGVRLALGAQPVDLYRPGDEARSYNGGYWSSRRDCGRSGAHPLHAEPAIRNGTLRPAGLRGGSAASSCGSRGGLLAAGAKGARINVAKLLRTE